MPKTITGTCQSLPERTGISVRVNKETGQITEMPIGLRVDYGILGEREETFYPWASLSAASKQKVADVLAEVIALIQAAYLT